MRFYAYLGADLTRTTINTDSLNTAVSEVKKLSIIHGQAYLYDSGVNKMIAHFVGGKLNNPRRYFRTKAEAERYIAQAKRHKLDVTDPAFHDRYGLYQVHVSKRTHDRMETLRGKAVKENPEEPLYSPVPTRYPDPKEIGAVSVGSSREAGQRGAGIAQFKNELRAHHGMETLHMLGFNVDLPYKSTTTNYWVVRFRIPKLASNPKYRLGQRRIYTVKSKREPRYKGSLPSRQTTFTSKRKAVMASNPKGVKIYGKLLRIEAKKTQKHVCDAACKKADHCYYHDFSSAPSIYGMPDGSLVIK